ncbi:MAG: hypothetical protein AAGC65_11555 [Mucilaginibacter sp.]|uniref:hypothetical protein n=1 Tax=Mucilaginibacter sp. TaxID=1882438 RepID=UPI0031A7924B
MLNSLFKKLNINQDKNSSDKPKQVVNGVILLYIAFILSMITDWLDGITVVPFILVFIIISLVITATAEGKKWARIIMVVLIVFNGLSFLLNVAQLLSHAAKGKFTDLVMVLYTIEIIAEIWALILLFSKPANAWYNRPRPEVGE